MLIAELELLLGSSRWPLSLSARLRVLHGRRLRSAPSASSWSGQAH